MLRITEYIRETLQGKSSVRTGGAVLIWNLTNRCNLMCRHCYAFATDAGGEELRLEELKGIIPQLAAEDIKFAILSGGEPLLKDGLFEIAKTLKERGIKTYLSSNGLLVTEGNIGLIQEHFDYVGISIDGEPSIHDAFRGREDAFDISMNAIRLCIKNGLRTGIRFTVTPETLKSLPFIFRLAEDEGIPKIYISHLVYSGRGGGLTDIKKEQYREVADFIMNKAFQYVEKDMPIDIVTGNNEADAVVLHKEFSRRFPQLSDRLYERLSKWGGNQAGVRLVNITYNGDVKPDPFYFHTLGNIKAKGFHEIWNSNGILSYLRESPRRLKGRCGECTFLEICNGNSRPRAYAVYGDYLQEDPACYI